MITCAFCRSRVFILVSWPSSYLKLPSPWYLSSSVRGERGKNASNILKFEMEMYFLFWIFSLQKWKKKPWNSEWNKIFLLKFVMKKFKLPPTLLILSTTSNFVCEVLRDPSRWNALGIVSQILVALYSVLGVQFSPGISGWSPHCLLGALCPLVSGLSLVPLSDIQPLSRV